MGILQGILSTSYGNPTDILWKSYKLLVAKPRAKARPWPSGDGVHMSIDGSSEIIETPIDPEKEHTRIFFQDREAAARASESAAISSWWWAPFGTASHGHLACLCGNMLKKTLGCSCRLGQ